MVRNRLCYGAILVGSVVFYAFYDQWFSTFFLYCVLLMPVFSLLCSIPAIRGFRISLELPHAVQQGDPACLRVQVRAPAALPRYELGLWMSQSYVGDEKLPRGDRIPLPAEHCGAVTVTAEKARRYDYLGLFAFPLGDIPPRRMLVRPRPQKPVHPPEPGTIPASALVPMPVGGFSEIHELREYRPGDSLRSIHWKASAKTDTLMVREPMEPARVDLALTGELRGSDRELDSLLGQLLWVSAELLERGLSHEIRILTGDGIVSREVSTPAQLTQAVDELLCAAPAEDGTLRVDAASAVWHYHITPNP